MINSESPGLVPRNPRLVLITLLLLGESSRTLLTMIHIYLTLAVHVIGQESPSKGAMVFSPPQRRHHPTDTTASC